MWKRYGDHALPESAAAQNMPIQLQPKGQALQECMILPSLNVDTFHSIHCSGIYHEALSCVYRRNPDLSASIFLFRPYPTRLRCASPWQARSLGMIVLQKAHYMPTACPRLLYRRPKPKRRHAYPENSAMLSLLSLSVYCMDETLLPSVFAFTHIYLIVLQWFA